MNVRKRGLALLMCICMIFTLLPFSAFADASADKSVVYGKYVNGTWTQVNTAGPSETYKDQDTGANIEYSKEATPVAGEADTYDITLKIKSTTTKTSPGASAVVLVIDTSGSMGEQNRLNNAKKVAAQFVKDYGKSGAERYIALVSFSKLASAKNFGTDNAPNCWLDASNEANRTRIIKAINSLYADGGTNLEQGLSVANSILGKNAATDIAKSNKFVIALTDGKPTYSGIEEYYSIIFGSYYGPQLGNGQDCNQEICDATETTATTLKGNVNTLYTVCYGAENEVTYKGGLTVGDFLAQKIASSGKAYNATDGDESLKNAFEAIYKSIQQGLSSGFTVNDPMGTNIVLQSKEITDAVINNNGFVWKPTKPSEIIGGENDAKTYIYTVTYRVKLDTSAEGFVDGKYYATNNDTTLVFKDGETDKTLHFNVPGVKGTAPEYTVTYKYTNSPENAPSLPEAASYSIHTDNINVAANPTLTGYDFSGWTTEDVQVNENGTFKMPGKAVTFTGTWTPKTNLSYTVHYYWNNTSDKVREDEVVTGKTFGDQVTEKPITIEGYTPVSDDEQTITIKETGNEITFYYYKNVELVANSAEYIYDGNEKSVSGFKSYLETDANHANELSITFNPAIQVGATGTDKGEYPAAFAEGTVGTVDASKMYKVTQVTPGTLTIYKATDAKATIKATKMLDNDAPGDVQFSFKLESTDGKDPRTIPNATNAPDGKIKFDLTYDKEGTYIYKLSEVKGTDTGIVYDETVYYVKVEVTLVEKAYVAKVSYFADADCNDQITTDNPTFKNLTAPGSLTISKTVSGNAAITTKEFTFIVKLIPNSDTTNNNIIYGNVTNVTVIDNEVRFKLKAGDSKTINGLPDGIRYTVQELDSNGYTVSAKVNDDPVTLENNMLKGTIAAGMETKIVFNNHKSYVYPPNPPIMDEIIVEITGNSDSVVYDGTEHSVKGYTVKISDPRYTEADFTFTGKAEASGVNAGTYEMGLKAEQFKNTNARFTNVKFVIKADGVLTITPKDLTITAGSKTEYGPTPVTCGEWTVSGLVAGDKVESVKITGIQSVPGSSPNVPSDAVIKNAKGEDVTKNYAIKYVNGTLTMLEVLNKEDHFNYIIGTPEGLSLPTANVTRAEVATIFFRLMTDDARAKFDSLDNNFSDVAKGKWYNRAISTLAKAGIIKGDPAGTYRPDDPITRAEMAAIIARFGDFKEGGKTFNDISGHWAQKYIELAASNGWINGNPDGTFKPNNNITRAETVAMINRVLDRQTKDVSDLLPVSQMTNWSDNMDTAKWYYRDMQEATNNHKAERVGDSIYEKWTEKLPDIDWASYQI